MQDPEADGRGPGSVPDAGGATWLQGEVQTAAVHAS